MSDAWVKAGWNFRLIGILSVLGILQRADAEYMISILNLPMTTV
jgi:hypothetical protein